MITEQQIVLGWQLNYPDCPNSSLGLHWAFKLGNKLPYKAYYYNNSFQTVFTFKKLQAGPVKQEKGLWDSAPTQLVFLKYYKDWGAEGLLQSHHTLSTG